MGVYGIRFNTSSLPSSSLDRSSVLYRCCTAALHDARPGCVIVPRIADARLARYGVHERIQSTGFTRFEIPRRAAEFSFVRNYIRVWEEEKREMGEKGRRRRKYGSSPWKRFADCREISNGLNNVSAEFTLRNSRRGTDTRDNLKRFAQSRKERWKNNEWNEWYSFLSFFFLFSRFPSYTVRSIVQLSNP